MDTFEYFDKILVEKGYLFDHEREKMIDEIIYLRKDFPKEEYSREHLEMFSDELLVNYWYNVHELFAIRYFTVNANQPTFNISKFYT